MRLHLTKIFTFDAAHMLPKYVGKCANLHGHQWTMEVEISGVPNKQTGMILDFVKLKEMVKPMIEKLDHHYLNDLFENPTAEIMVIHITAELALLFSDFTEENIELERIRLYETPTSYIEWRKEQ